MSNKLYILLIFVFFLISCSEQSNTDDTFALIYESSMELQYAQNFSVDYYKGGYKLITINNDEKFLTISENATMPDDIPNDVTILQMPLTNVLVSSTPAVSFINAIDAIDNVSMTTTDVNSWYINEVKTAMENNLITYIGAIREPDYELVTAGLPTLAIYSTEILSVPEIVEKFNELEIPLLIDWATFENHPLARVEWIKLYGALFDLESTANMLFDEQVAYVNEISYQDTEKSAVIFYITSKGTLYTRQGGDYMAKMLELAGGNYIFADVNPEKSGINQMDFETFYAAAKDADYIIYIWNLGGKPETLADILEKNELFNNFKAVEDNNVWCTTPDYFQVSNMLGYMIKDINMMFTLEDDSVNELTYLFKLT